MKKFSVCLAAVSAFVVMLFSISVSSAEDTNKIRVGFPIQNFFTEVDEDGKLSGYTYEYLQEIAQHTGWDYEFVIIDHDDINTNLSLAYEMLENGEIDILGSTVKNKYTVGIYDLTEHSYGTIYSTLNVLEGNTVINDTNFHSFPNLRIAVPTYSTDKIQLLEKFCESNNMPYELVYCDSDEQLLQALHDDRADAVLEMDSHHLGGTRVVAKFGGNSFYFATTLGNNDVLSSLDIALSKIKQSEPYFSDRLYQKYFNTTSTSVILTEDEMQYIQSLPTLRVGFIPTAKPLQYLDENGDPAGISSSVMEYIHESTGIEMQLVVVPSYDEAYKMVADGKLDIIAGVGYDYELASTHNLVLSKTYFTSQSVTLYHSSRPISELENPRIGYLRGIDVPSDIPEDSPYLFNTVQDAADAMLAGKIDKLETSFYSAGYLTKQKKYSDLQFAPDIEKEINNCIGMAKPVDIKLITILNKTLEQISSRDLEMMLFKSTSDPQDDFTLMNFIDSNPREVILFIVLAAVVLLAVLSYILRIRTISNHQLYLETQRHIKLSELANEYIYQYDLKKDELEVSAEFAKMLGIDTIQSGFTDSLDTVSSVSDLALKQLDVILSKAFENSGPAEFLMPLADGTERWFKNIPTTINDKHGNSAFVIGKLVDIQKEVEQRDELKEKSQRDGLTNIYNSAVSSEMITAALADMSEGQSGAMIILDVDNFKNINDTYGHYAGDVTLYTIAEKIKGCVRDNDIIGRLGGDEFIIYLQQVSDKKELAAICERICSALRMHMNVDDIVFDITVSAGATMSDFGSSYRHLYQRADAALYMVKNRGRNGYEILSK